MSGISPPHADPVFRFACLHRHLRASRCPMTHGIARDCNELNTQIQKYYDEFRKDLNQGNFPAVFELIKKTITQKII